MPYDLFISYSRNDNLNNRVTELKEQIEAEYLAFTSEELKCFFDHEEIKGMEDWRQRLLKGLKESHLFLLILSPNYIESDYCGWEIVEYLKYEHARATQGEGVAQVYFLEIPGLDQEEFQTKAKAWLEKVSRRQRFDFRPWYDEGMDALKRADIKKRLEELKVALRDRIVRMRTIASSPSNLPSPNARFVGREGEMILLHESVGLGKFGVITAIHGMGGLGKTAIAFQYAFTYAAFYPGGRWYIGCAGESRLSTALKKLDYDLKILFTEEEKKDDLLGAKRILNELEHKACKTATKSNTEIPATLLLLDNVDNAEFMQSSCIDLVSGKEWLKLVITTRLGPEELGKDETRQKLIAIDELPFEDSVSLIEKHMPGEMFPDAKEREKAGEIVKLLGCFTLAVEVASKYLQERSGRISCADFLELLKREGELSGIEFAGSQANMRTSVDHSKLISVTLAPTLEMLAPVENQFLSYAAMLPPDAIPVHWIRELCKENYPEIAKDAPAGIDDPWLDVLNHLISLRILQIVEVDDIDKNQVRIVRMHRLVRQLISERSNRNLITAFSKKTKLGSHIYLRSFEVSKNPVKISLAWELNCLFKTIQILFAERYLFAEKTSFYCCNALKEYGRYSSALDLAELTLETLKNSEQEPEVSIAWFHNLAGVAALSLSKAKLAEIHFLEAEKLSRIPGADELDLLDSLNNIGCLYRDTYRPSEALKYLKEAYALAKTKFGYDSYQVTLFLINLGLVYQDLCELDEAVDLFKHAVEIGLRYPDQILNNCKDLSTLADGYRVVGKLSEAEIIAKKAYDYLTNSGYEQHPIAVRVKHNYGKVLESQSRFEEANILYVSALETAINCFGKSSPHTAFCLNNLAVNFMYLGDLERAIELLKESISIELQRNPIVLEKLANRELNIGIFHMLINDLLGCEFHLNSGWNYKLASKCHDLISVRLLMARIVLSYLKNEPSVFYVGQFLKLIEQDKIPASNIDFLWSFKIILDNVVSEFCPHKFEKWQKLHNLIDLKMTGSSDIENLIPKTIPLINLDQK
ncbi:MAG: toll/interleukin-1 receptor domain-containing protein [Bacteroidales bacterium]|nr:toll/interleukin-1 receptor domain-containing protein [Bacteroidales bacterium]